MSFDMSLLKLAIFNAGERAQDLNVTFSLFLVTILVFLVLVSCHRIQGDTADQSDGANVQRPFTSMEMSLRLWSRHCDLILKQEQEHHFQGSASVVFQYLSFIES